MNTTIKSLQALYVKNGGKLTDTYSDIAGGAAVGNYTTIPDCIAACAKLTLGGGGGSLPDDFPAEDIANANKFLGFDENGDYAALDAPQGLPADFPAEAAGNANKYIGFDANGDYEAKDAPSVSLPAGTNDGDILIWDDTDDEWDVGANPYAPLIVTLTADQSTGNLVGDKTYSEVFDAMRGGRRCVIPITIDGLIADAAQVLDCIALYSNGTLDEYMVILPSFTDGGAVLASFTGAPSDYVTLTMG